MMFPLSSFMQAVVPQPFPPLLSLLSLVSLPPHKILFLPFLSKPHRQDQYDNQHQVSRAIKLYLLIGMSANKLTSQK